ncbi:MAG: nuclear transport factor 2 family protein [Firmicutes bacterium]|nr:nuclear transport factor 2 family protein [Bacillota bacterium]
MNTYDAYMEKMEYNKELLRKWLKAGDDADRDAYVELTHPDHVVINALDPDMPSVVNYEEHWNYIVKMKGIYPDMEHKPLEIYAEDDHVIIKGQVSGSNANGKTVFAMAMFASVKDGKVFETCSIASMPSVK